MIPVAKAIYGLKEIWNIIKVAFSFKYASGKYDKLFSDKLKLFLCRKYALTCNSGSSANLLAISALLSPTLKGHLVAGDEVITTASCFPTTINPIIQNNLVPVFVDIKLSTLNIDEKLIEKAITDKTKAIVVTNTLGNPCNFKEIEKICKKHSLWLIVDNCDSLGSMYNGKQSGAYGDIATQSFYPAHHISTGEGGACTTDNKQLYDIMKSLRDWGRECSCEPNQDNKCGKRFTGKRGELPVGYDHKYIYSHIGYNLKMTEFSAAIGLAQMERINKFNLKRMMNKFMLDNIVPSQHISEIESLTFWFGHVVTEVISQELIEHFESNGIATRRLFAGNITKHPAYLKYHKDLEITNYVMRNTFWIGCHPALKKKDFDYIENINNLYWVKV